MTNDSKEPGIIKQLREENEKVVPIHKNCLPRSYPLEEFLKVNIPEVEMIMNPWLPQKGITMIHAKRGVGKTFFCLSLAYAICIGKPFLGWTVPKPRKVLYIDGEMRAKTMQIRISQIAKMFDCYDTNYNFEIITPDLMDYPLNLYTLEQQSGINELIQKKSIELVIMDNMSSLMYGWIENDPHTWEPLQAWELLLRKMGVSVVRVMHSGKGDKVRCSSKVEDILDTTIHLKHPNDYDIKEGARFVVEFEKNRDFYGDSADPFEIQLKEKEDRSSQYWARQDIYVSTYNQVIKYLNEGYKNYEIADLLKISRGMVTKHTKKAQSEGRIYHHI